MTDETRPGGGPDWEQELLAALADAGRLEAVPVEAFAAAKSAFAWRTLDAELAALTYDSDIAEDAMAGMRSTGTAVPRALTFEASGLTVELEVVEGDGGRRLLGQLVPPQPGTVEARQFAATTTVEADEVGRFTVVGLQSGPVSLRCEAQGGGAAVVTDWFVL